MILQVIVGQRQIITLAKTTIFWMRVSDSSSLKHAVLAFGDKSLRINSDDIGVRCLVNISE